MSTLFISDLHLGRERPALTELLLAFLESYAAGNERLYILGDLFEVWLGDDAVPPEYRPVLAALQHCAQQGTEIFFMHGNRDFLCGASFAQQSGCTLIDDPTEITLGTQRLLLMHGDTLCTDDHDYQAFRARIRDPQFIRDFLARPPAQRQEIAAYYREQSREHSGRKQEDIMDVNADAVMRALREHHSDILIHGHTHRPAIHELMPASGAPARRIVLGDWSEQHGSVLLMDGDDCRLQQFTLADLRARGRH